MSHLETCYSVHFTVLQKSDTASHLGIIDEHGTEKLQLTEQLVDHDKE